MYLFTQDKRRASDKKLWYSCRSISGITQAELIKRANEILSQLENQDSQENIHPD